MYRKMYSWGLFDAEGELVDSGGRCKSPKDAVHVATQSLLFQAGWLEGDFEVDVYDDEGRPVGTFPTQGSKPRLRREFPTLEVEDLEGLNYREKHRLAHMVAAVLRSREKEDV